MPTRYRDSVGPHVVRRHAVALADLADAHPPDTPVPTCGDWSLADLVWHVGEVQDFWAFVIANRPAGPEAYDQPERPGDLAGFLRDRCDRLVTLLDSADDDEPAWTWSDEQTVGFTVRRQSHEALVHHVDGLLACGAELPDVDPRLAADGVDELITVMLGGLPDWATFTPSGRTIELVATDTRDRWPLAFGRMSGTSPTTGTHHDLVALEPIRDRDGDLDTTVSARALDLDLWSWGRRPDEAVVVAGDPAGAADLRAAVIDATQ